jgi:hypothetical protein
MPSLPIIPEVATPATLTMSTSSFTNYYSEVTGALRSRDTAFDISEMSSQYLQGLQRVDSNWQFRTGYTAVSLFCMMILALMLGKTSNLYTCD